MASADVGDDVYGEDPTVHHLEERVADLLGKEAALFVPSGTMANQLAIRCACESGDEVVIEASGHSFGFETGAAAALCGVQLHPVSGTRGIFDTGVLEAAIRPQMIAFPRTRMVIVENTHNFGGGTVWPLPLLRSVAHTAHHHGLFAHLDGARLLNAQVASGHAASVLAEPFDSVSLCLSKGLGAPVGSVLAGSREWIERARRFRKMFGGGMRQAGVLAAAGLYALEHHVDRLVEDHRRARRLAEGIAGLPGLEVDLEAVETNIVFVTCRPPAGPAADLASRLAAQGVRVGVTGHDRIRLVTHLDVGDEDVRKAIEAFAACV